MVIFDSNTQFKNWHIANMYCCISLHASLHVIPLSAW